MASAVDSRLAYARLSAVATASRLPTANRGSNNSYTTSWDTTTPSPDGARATDTGRLSVYYTRLPVVSLVLDEVMDGLTGKETVLDLTCGSGVFLVEALRRLVHLKSGGDTPSRELIRTTLYQQVLPIRLTPMTATCRVPPLSRVKLGIGWSRGVARDAEQ